MSAASHGGDGVQRRDFLVITAGAFVGVGGAGLVWPFVDQMNPSADVLALSSTEVDISGVAEGQSITISWRGKPVFVRHRTAKEIEEAVSVPLADLPDPEADAERVKDGKDQWLIVLGVCTHLGCVPIGAEGNRGEYDGWFCPCHGSHYDTSGRIRKGPAPANLEVPPYEFLTDTQIKIG
ncbi:MAG: ubiquinol-cytochrome c reductase iron-sulfur subunit [Pseudomonadota bacterium]|nr:ubiquinol-cytochrome c reductase iron-sulfur subunit [Pseudomonadota bacterium]